MGRHMFLIFKFSENWKKHVAIPWEDHTAEQIFSLPENISRNSDGVKSRIPSLKKQISI